MRTSIAIAIATLAGAAMCGDDSASDAGVDAADGSVRDVPVDVARDEGVDVARDVLGDVSDAGEAGWDSVPLTPESCDLEYSTSPELVLEEIRWGACPSGDADDCSILEYSTGFRTSRENVTRTHSPVGVEQPLFELTQASDGGELRVTTQLIDPSGPRVMAAWRSSFNADVCVRGHAGTDAEHLGFEVRLPGKESLFFRTRLDALPSMPTEPVGRLTASEQPGAVAAQGLEVSPTTLGVVLQPGAVLWLFEDPLQLRRGGPLEPDVPGAVLNQFSIVDRRIYWATSEKLVVANTLEAPSEQLHDPAGDLAVRWPKADEELVAWVEWDGDEAVDLWSGAVTARVEDFMPQHVAALPQLNLISLGDGLIAFRQTEPGPERVLLFDLRDGSTGQWVVPTGWDVGNEMLWVNQDGIGLVGAREGQIFISTAMRVPRSSFESI